MKIAVIGAGLAGIAAARRLKERGAEVVVFEKSRGYGGRCASKRWEDQTLDHGAQYFTLRDPGFRETALGVCRGRLKALKGPILTFDGEEWRGGPRYYHIQGNSRLVRELAGTLEVRTGVLVEKVEAEGGGWRIGSETFDQVLSTAPLPQTRRLAGLEMGDSEYAACLTLLLLYKGEKIGKTGSVYAYADPLGEELIWTACENHKENRIRAGRTALVVHASENFSAMHLESDPEKWTRKLRGLAEARWRISSADFLLQYPHRWRYARVMASAPVPELPPGWHFAGDALSESRVESAWLAGQRVAEGMEI